MEEISHKRPFTNIPIILTIHAIVDNPHRIDTKGDDVLLSPMVEEESLLFGLAGESIGKDLFSVPPDAGTP